MSKTILFSLCWLGEPWRIERNIKWLEYHLPLKEKLGFDEVFLLDNASSPEDLKKLESFPDVTIYRFDEHLPRTGIHQYPYCWRGLEHVKTLLPDLDKIIFLDSDFYITSGKFAKYIKDLDTGWTSTWCHKYGWPEAALHILCKDTFQSLIDLPIPNYTYYNDKNMEEILPFTKILRTEFTGDRYGEGNLPQTSEMDYYGQHQPGGPELRFNE